MPRNALFLLVPFALGCPAESNLHPADDSGAAATPSILVAPTSIDFEGVDVAAKSPKTVEVQVSNEGDGTLRILGLEATGTCESSSSEVFDVTAPGETVLEEAASTSFLVSFEPVADGSCTGHLEITSNDPEAPTVRVDLAGMGLAPALLVDPAEVDFGSIYLGCDASRVVSLTNDGSGDLTVSDVSLDTPTSEIALVPFKGKGKAEGGDWSVVTLAPGDSTSVELTFLPVDETAHEATLTIVSNDPTASELRVPVTGSGLPFDAQHEVFEQVPSRNLDVVMAVDRSDSMRGALGDILADFSNFIEALRAGGSAWRLAAIVEDDGCVVGPDTWIDASFSTEEAVAAFTTQLDTSGSEGANAEKGFTLLQNALSEANLGAGGCNENLLRDAAVLHLVGVSDEPEQSTGGTWSDYVALFQALEPDPDLVKIDAIGGDSPKGCASAFYYSGFYDAMEATGGSFVSICTDDWAGELLRLGGEMYQLIDTFPLSAVPVVKTLKVTSAGVSVSGWTYDAHLNALVFDADEVPAPGTVIDVDYTVDPGC
jgi:hypothetical protein